MKAYTILIVSTAHICCTRTYHFQLLKQTDFYCSLFRYLCGGKYLHVQYQYMIYIE